MTSYKQDPPFALQVELVEGCNLRCSFCSLNAIRGKENNFKFMEMDTIISLMEQVQELGWNPRVEFAMHGEPSMHPDFALMIEAARACAPNLQLMMTSNGGGFLKKPGVIENIHAVFEAGLNVLAFDDYESIRIVSKIRDRLKDLDPSIKVYEYPKDPEGNPHKRRPKTEKALILIQDIEKASTGTHARLTNQGGTAFPPDDSQHGKRCAKPFRELSVRWDGNVAICCDSWDGKFFIGNILDGLDKVWQHPRFMAARKFLLNGDRSALDPCASCNVVSYRPGLLPDKFGKQKMDPITEADRELVRKVNSEKPLTPLLNMKWQRTKPRV